MSFHALLIFLSLVFLTKESFNAVLGENSQQMLSSPGVKVLDILLINAM